MGKVSIRRTGIINYLKEHGCVERKELWTFFSISENRLCEDLKALEVNGYHFDTSRSGYVSLIETDDTNANIYEPITTSILRKWFLLAWISISSEIYLDTYNDEEFQIGLKLVYDKLFKIYKRLYKANDPHKITYKLNTFHRDIRDLCKDNELACDVNQLFEEKKIARPTSNPFFVIITQNMAKKMLFALSTLDQDNPHVQSLAGKLLLAYPNIIPDKPIKTTCKIPETRNVYDRISTFVAYNSVAKTPNNLDDISSNTGIPLSQIKKDFKNLNNNIGRRLFGKTGFRTEVFVSDIPEMSNFARLYSGNNYRFLFLPSEEYLLYKSIRYLNFILGSEFDMDANEKILINYGGKPNWYMDIEEMWYL